VDLWLSQWLPAETATAGIVASNGAVAAFLLANHRLPGMALAGAGLVLNLLVIAANGAMPVSQRAARIAGLPRDALSQPGIKHEVLGNDTALSPLADVIPLPGTGQVISAGDIVLAAGIGRLVYARTRAGRKKQQETLDS
jgi:hypothetical protein